MNQKFGIRKCGEADQSVEQRLGDACFLKIDEIGCGDRERSRHRTRQCILLAFTHFPRFRLILLGNEGNVERMRTARSIRDGLLDRVGRHRLDRSQVSPLVRVGLEVLVDENTAILLARRLLQRKCYQIAEATFRHRVLVREEAVVGCQLQLPGSHACTADDRGAQASRIPSRYGRPEENPDVCAIAGSRDFQRSRYA
nr:hypothetical protein [Burkholderia thailandensis]